jgi:hypothetical protein
VVRADLLDAPIFWRFGFDPHRPDLEWFFQERTIVLGRRPASEYLAEAGLSFPFLLWMPVDAIRRPRSLALLGPWTLLALVLSFRSFRAFTATVPLVASIYASLPIAQALGRLNARRAGGALVGLLVAVLGLGWAVQYWAASAYDTPEMRDPGSLALLEQISRTCPDEITADCEVWLTPDQTVGRCRSIVGLYLQYLPPEAGQRFRDLSRLYLLEDEDEAAALCKRYGIRLLIARKRFLAHPNFLFSPSDGIERSDYFRLGASGPEPTARGRRTLLVRMVLGTPRLEKFEKVLEDRGPDSQEPDAVVFRVR